MCEWAIGGVRIAWTWLDQERLPNGRGSVSDACPMSNDKLVQRLDDSDATRLSGGRRTLSLASLTSVAQIVIAILRLQIDALAKPSIQLDFQLSHFVSNGMEPGLDRRHRFVDFAG